MDEEHRKDREAFERLMRLIPDTVAATEEGPKIVPAGNHAVNEPDTLTDMDQLCLGLMREQPERDWTIRDLMSGMESSGFKLPAIRPEAVLNRCMRRLIAHQKVLVILQPQGRRAGVYRFNADTEEHKKAS